MLTGFKHSSRENIIAWNLLISLGMKNTKWSCYFCDKGEISQSFILTVIEACRKVDPASASDLISRVTPLHPNVHKLLDRLHSC